jgi:hypothetical protein
VGSLLFLIGLLAVVVLALVVALLTRKAPYVCPPGTSILATVKRHSDAGPLFVTLEAAGIDTQIVEEPAKSLWRRLPLLLYRLYPAREPSGPWHIVVSTPDLARAQQVLAQPPAEGSATHDGSPA